MNPITIIWLSISLLLSVLLPIVLLFVWRKRTGARLLTALAGAATFVVFALILEQLLHSVVLSLPIMATQGALYVVYAGLAAGLFEETGRLVAFRFLLRKDRMRKDAVMYGIGHGGIEAILLAGLATITNLVAAITLLSGGEAAILATYGESATVILQGFQETAPSLFLVTGIERVIAIALHISLSVLVFYAVWARKPLYWLWAVLLHAAVDCFAALYHIGVIPQILWIELGVAAMTAGIVVFAWLVYRKMPKDTAVDAQLAVEPAAETEAPQPVVEVALESEEAPPPAVESAVEEEALQAAAEPAVEEEAPPPAVEPAVEAEVPQPAVEPAVEAEVLQAAAKPTLEDDSHEQA